MKGRGIDEIPMKSTKSHEKALFIDRAWGSRPESGILSIGHEEKALFIDRAKWPKRLDNRVV